MHNLKQIKNDDLPLTAFVWLLLIELALTDPLNPGLTGTPPDPLPPFVGGQPVKEPVWSPEVSPPGGDDFFAFRGDLYNTIKKYSNSQKFKRLIDLMHF